MDRCPQRCYLICLFRHKLLAYITFVPGSNNRPHNSRVMQFLRIVNLVPAGYTAGMVMGNVLVVICYVTHNIALHYLHMINIEEQFKIF